MTNPVLHPNSTHFNVEVVKLLVHILDLLLTTDHTYYHTVLNPLGKRLHSANSERYLLSQFKVILTRNYISLEHLSIPVLQLDLLLGERGETEIRIRANEATLL